MCFTSILFTFNIIKMENMFYAFFVIQEMAADARFHTFIDRKINLSFKNSFHSLNNRSSN
jgi:hypothetical protein